MNAALSFRVSVCRLLSASRLRECGGTGRLLPIYRHRRGFRSGGRSLAYAKELLLGKINQ
ncbi:hypothetical protein chiPu_0030694, partial [Chiloscyllium punctatum]|nr:hypothetical protein [Chiloscyllium punctatum]